jgi:apolipoprotein N-acyltransferase
LWYLIGLSALMFNLAFFFPDYCGFLILFFIVPLAGVVISSRHAWRDGFVWGLSTFGPHFSWLFLVIYRHSAAHWSLAMLVYLVVVAYFSITSGCWLWLSAQFFKGVHRFFFFMGISLAYWFVAIDWIVKPFGFIGYPFINPLIPLAAYRPFLRLVAVCTMMITGRHGGGAEAPTFVYCSPVVNRIVNVGAPWRKSPYGVGQKIYEELAGLHAVHVSHQGTKIFVTPESMFCFPLNCYPRVIAHVSKALSDDEHLLMGSIIERGGRYFQAVFWLHKGLIIKFYVKKLLTPFVEKMPDTWKSIQTLKQPFLGDAAEFCDQAHDFGASFFDIEPNLRIIPRICLEFFYGKRHDFDKERATDRNVWVFLFANESWFDGVFKKILFLSAKLTTNYIGLPVLYSGHFGCQLIIPETK